MGIRETSQKVTLKQTTIEELDALFAIESRPENAKFVMPYSLEQHREVFAQENVIYLSIVSEGQLEGFVILGLEGDNNAEFRRIIVNGKGKGLGQQAMLAVEIYCLENGITRLWLDVFGDNERGQHIYKKLGYQIFDEQDYHGRQLIFYGKKTDCLTGRNDYFISGERLKCCSNFSLSAPSIATALPDFLSRHTKVTSASAINCSVPATVITCLNVALLPPILDK